ncbi:MAG: translation initiation factor IF-2 [Candidatus Thermoplasmatota archaeon]|jgi:translation initiation factor 5B|nr:translation initiation factor IF-2 [Candidatus Thermoplasmatota archaeon]MCL5785182.1 translation initiation factor IF-2 [Candidatus Thermoplasmatota archaeon]
MEEKRLRQPIVCVLGHVDHGKTTLLDQIRGTAVARSEAGGITQRIGATEIDRTHIEKIAKDLLKGGKIRIPGLLFIDTPGHVAFSNMRARGGALADIAVLVVDINDGLMPQTRESIHILKKFKTPFVVAANKIDLVDLYTDSKSKTFKGSISRQRPEYIENLDAKVYDLVSSLYSLGFSADRYDRVSDFSSIIAIVPVSAKSGLGVPDLLMVLSGLAQKYLERDIGLTESGGQGTVIEVKKETSIGTTLDTVLFQGKLSRSDSIAVNSSDGPATTRIKAIFVNSGTRNARLAEKDTVSAAAGVRILISDKLSVIPGTPLIAVDGNTDDAYATILAESTPNISTEMDGITVKADALGSLEAICYELQQKSIRIRSATIGDISRKDVVSISTLNNQMDRVVIGFNVQILPDAKDLPTFSDIGIISGNVIYSIVADTEKWLSDRRAQIEESRKDSMPVPSRIFLMPEYVFRATKPVIIGVRVLSGRVKVGDDLIKSDGRFGGTVKSIRDGDVSKRYSDAGSEVAVAIDGITLGRQISAGETLYTDITEEVVRSLRAHSLDEETMKTMEEIISIKRKQNMFWGTKA